MNNFDEIQALLQEKADFQARINLIPYDGSPEVKENSSGKYLYMLKRFPQAQNLRTYSDFTARISNHPQLLDYFSSFLCVNLRMQHSD